MKTHSPFVAVLASAAALAACGGSIERQLLAPTPVAAVSGEGSVTSLGNGPGAPSTNPGTCTGTGTGTCTGGGGNGYGPGPGAGGGTCTGDCTGQVGPDPADIGVVLASAIQEEYKAQALYRSVLEDFGASTAPFAMIAESEGRHVEVIQQLFTRRQLVPPPSAWSPAGFAPFAALAQACAAGVTAEREDADFYTPYLRRADLPQDVRNVFTNLQAASLEAHLPAFQACQ